MPGPSRATAGPQTSSRGPLERKILNVFFQNGTFWRTLYLWPTVGLPNVAGPGVAYPLLQPLDGPVQWYVHM